jgi:hypothetical protein
MSVLISGGPNPLFSASSDFEQRVMSKGGQSASGGNLDGGMQMKKSQCISGHIIPTFLPFRR